MILVVLLRSQKRTKIYLFLFKITILNTLNEVQEKLFSDWLYNKWFGNRLAAVKGLFLGKELKDKVW